MIKIIIKARINGAFGILSTLNKKKGRLIFTEVEKNIFYKHLGELIIPKDLIAEFKRGDIVNIKIEKESD